MSRQEQAAGSFGIRERGGGVPQMAQGGPYAGGGAGPAKRGAGGGTPQMSADAFRDGKPFSVWLRQMYDATYSQENAKDSPEGELDASLNYFSEYIDAVKSDPIIFQEAMDLFMVEPDLWIFELFPEVITDQLRVESTRIRFDLDLLEIGTRKVPGRNIHSTVQREEQHLLYRIQQFVKDYDHMKKKKGMLEWNAFADAVQRNIYATIIMDGMLEFRMRPSAYFLPEHVYPFQGMPQTPEQVFQREAAWFGAYNRRAQAHKDICAMVARIFEQNRESLRGFIMSRADLYHINVQDETNIYADKSGAEHALAARRDGAMITTLLGNRVYVPPLLEGQLHNDNDEYVLQSEVQVGSMWSFPEMGVNSDPDEYRSYMRDVETCSHSTNDWDKYSFADFLAHCPHFVRDPNDTLGGYMDGQINEEFLKTLSRDAMNTLKDTGCEPLPKNLHRLDPLLTFNPDAGPDEERFTKATTFGTLNPEFISLDAMDFCCKTVLAAVARENNGSIADLPGDQFNNLLNKIFPGGSVDLPPHPKFKPLMTQSELGSAASFFLQLPLNIANIRACEAYHIAIPLGGMCVRIAEGQFMHHQIALADGIIGKSFRSPIDNTVGFRQHPREFSFAAALDQKVVIQYPERFFMVENTRGGAYIGGKGNQYVTENVVSTTSDDPDWPYVVENISISGKLGDRSIIPILQGYDEARKPFRTRHIDVRGRWFEQDFAGRLHESHEFRDMSPEQMFVGQAALRVLFEFNRTPPTLDLDKMSTQNRMALRQQNYHCHQTSQIVYDKFNGRREIQSHHPWGKQHPGLAALEQGLQSVKA